MRFLLRLFSFLALVLAVIAGTTDAIESVALSDVVTTPFGSLWADVGPASLALVKQALTTHIGDNGLQLADDLLLRQPAFAVFLVIALLLWIAGYKRRAAAGRFAA
ncbi:hypothetical protein [Allorhizobium taibaishanense]|uniref:Uncharacterized protein n=1 Tax=Allorhizobium taibaishanense TaxID=887144 RepID=A0A1Q9A970_9HYPH|nr:hypothetical protein [Allorhizobium taibaishanense]MBB4009632.1 hypothetical protein [Allorhizobium taibaishanense]OLP51118.1 hypothetical protein BJF91_06300 [Allorhizobium taibaishanense]